LSAGERAIAVMVEEKFQACDCLEEGAFRVVPLGGLGVYGADAEEGVGCGVGCAPEVVHEGLVGAGEGWGCVESVVVYWGWQIGGV